jgi:hypothetical protein
VENIQRQKDENDKTKNKLFIVENAIIKKDNLIQGLKKKLDKYSESDDNKYLNYPEKEVFIIEPNVAVTQMHDELLLYKQIYENLMVHIRDNKTSMMKYENIITVLKY